MNYQIYGLRLAGEFVPSYIGMTRRGADYRLQRHLSYALNRTSDFANWLNANRNLVEVCVLAEAADREAAKSIERATIETLVADGHLLFNQVHVRPVARRPKRKIIRRFMATYKPDAEADAA